MEGDTLTFRIASKHFLTGLLCAVGFSALAVGLPILALWNPDGSIDSPMVFAVIMGGFWGCWALLSVWLTAFAAKHRLIFDTRRVTLIGAAAQRRVHWVDLTSARWRQRPAGGSVVLKTIGVRIVIHFSNYEPSDGAAIRRLVRKTAPKGLQEGWPEFVESRRPKPPTASQLRAKKMLLAIFLAFGVASAWMWWVGGGARFGLLAILNPAVVAWIVWRNRLRKRRKAFPFLAAGTKTQNSKLTVDTG